jgi:hypothetical protein
MVEKHLDASAPSYLVMARRSSPVVTRPTHFLNFSVDPLDVTTCRPSPRLHIPRICPPSRLLRCRSGQIAPSPPTPSPPTGQGYHVSQARARSVPCSPWSYSHGHNRVQCQDPCRVIKDCNSKKTLPLCKRAPPHCVSPRLQLAL